MRKEKTFKELAKDEPGTIYHDEMDEGIRFIVMRGPASLCAYAGIPLNHPLAGMEYDDLPIDAHGGLTFSEKGGGKWPKNYWWYGWDYAHLGDRAFYDLDRVNPFDRDEKEWTVKEVVDDSWSALYDIKKLMKLTEAIYNKIKKEAP